MKAGTGPGSPEQGRAPGSSTGVATGPGRGPGPGGYRHEALLYSGDDEFVALTSAFLRAGLEAGDQAFVVVAPAKAAPSSTACLAQSASEASDAGSASSILRKATSPLGNSGPVRRKAGS